MANKTTGKHIAVTAAVAALTVLVLVKSGALKKVGA